MNEKITIWYKTKKQFLEKEALANILILKLSDSNEYNFVLQYLNKIDIIQIYSNKVVRLHMIQKPYESRKTVFIKSKSEEFANFLISLI